MASPDTFNLRQPHEWLLDLADRLARGQPQVMVTVVKTQGSTPRDVGSHMWVGSDFIADTIGGGHLEWKAIASARNLLKEARRDFRIERYPLGPSLGQCCGGVVWLLYEYLDRDDATWCAQIAASLAQGKAVCRRITLSSFQPAQLISRETTSQHIEPLSVDTLNIHNVSVIDTQKVLAQPGAKSLPYGDDTDRVTIVDTWWASTVCIVVCGAGHIGNAIVRLLGDLPVQVIWLDPRENCWPARLPDNVRTLQGDADDVPDMPDQAYWLVLTHNHALDLAIIDAVFRHKSFAFLGLIGSKSKKARFVSRLSRRYPSGLVERICCPIGVVQTSSKLPSVIAVSVVAQLLGLMTT